MAIFKSDEEKAAEQQRQKEGYKAYVERQRAAEEIRKLNDSPIGRARKAYSDGLGYFQAEIDIEKIEATDFITKDVEVSRTEFNVGEILDGIEEEGWMLIQSGFVFRQTGQDSRNLTSVVNAHSVVSGQVVGLYLFKRNTKRKEV